MRMQAYVCVGIVALPPTVSWLLATTTLVMTVLASIDYFPIAPAVDFESVDFAV